MRTTAQRIYAIFIVGSCAITPLGAAENTATQYKSPRTEYGQPELRGVWNFSSDTPLERPARYKDRPSITREEWDAQHQQRRDRADSNEREGRGLANSPVGGYNEFWTESLAQHPDLRTSLIVDPPDGRMPAFQPGIKAENGGLGWPHTAPVRWWRFAR